MKTKPVIIFMLFMLLSGCITPAYLPYASKIDVNTYGSYVVLQMNTGQRIAGELIAADDSAMLVLSDDEQKADKVISEIPFPAIKSYTLQFAKPKQYFWAVLPGLVLPVIPFPDPEYPSDMMPFHGFFAGLTIPLNLIAVTATYLTARHTLIYSGKTLSESELRNFARFPQGLPEGVSLTEIAGTQYPKVIK